MTLFTQLFSNYSNVLYWKIDFAVNNQMKTGISSLILKKNFLPRNGFCYVDKLNGVSLLTIFNIICENWIDPDGSINAFEYMGIILNILNI